MIESLFRLVSGVLAFFFNFTHSYGLSIMLLTICVMIVTAPLTLKSTRSMVQMQRMQPELKKLQAKYKDDREQLNVEMMAFYKENNINPLSGCVPVLMQTPIFLILYQVLRGLIERGAGTGSALGDATGRLITNGSPQRWLLTDQVFKPLHLNESTELFQSLSHSSKMKFLGVDLAITPLQSFSLGITVAIPFVILVLVMFASQWYQNRQIQGRSQGNVNPQQQMMMKFLPFMLPLFSLSFPAGLAWYYLIQGFCRIGLQSYITKSIYHPEQQRNAGLEVSGVEVERPKERSEPVSERAKAARAKQQPPPVNAPSKRGSQPRKSGAPRSKPRSK